MSVLSVNIRLGREGGREEAQQRTFISCTNSFNLAPTPFSLSLSTCPCDVNTYASAPSDKREMIFWSAAKVAWKATNLFLRSYTCRVVLPEASSVDATRTEEEEEDEEEDVGREERVHSLWWTWKPRAPFRPSSSL